MKNKKALFYKCLYSRIPAGLIRWGLLLGWCAGIYIFSSQPSFTEGFSIGNFLLRKAGHVTEYAVLTLLAYNVFPRTKKVMMSSPAIRSAMLFALLYAILDEVHQLFVLGRHGVFTDVLIDSMGIALAVWAILRSKFLKEKATNAMYFFRTLITALIAKSRFGR